MAENKKINSKKMAGNKKLTEKNKKVREKILIEKNGEKQE